MFDVGAFLKALILLLLAGAGIGLLCYIVVRLLAKFFGGTGDWAWFVYAIGGLIVLLIAWNLFSPMLG